MTKFSQFLNDESGATAIEYGLIAAILSVGIITVLGTVRDNLDTTFQSIADELEASGAV
jgi:pilus assembly protein Flp/PilA